MHYDIQAPLKSYHDHNKEQQTDYLIEQLQQGINIALVSDAGLPLISDPGYELVVAARENGIRVEYTWTKCRPNCTNGEWLTFLYLYVFRFLPRKDKQKQSYLEQRMYENSTLIIYESPHRVKDTVKTIQKLIESVRYLWAEN